MTYSSEEDISVLTFSLLSVLHYKAMKHVEQKHKRNTFVFRSYFSGVEIKEVRFYFYILTQKFFSQDIYLNL